MHEIWQVLLWFSLIQYYVWIVLSQFQNLAGPTYRDALFKVKHHTFICCYGQPKVIYLMSDFWSTCPTLPKHIVAQTHIFQLVVHSRNHAFPDLYKGVFFSHKLVVIHEAMFFRIKSNGCEFKINKCVHVYNYACMHVCVCMCVCVGGGGGKG